ncbi:MAG: hypothetical protein A3E98_03785 [Candidatus Doudnabacteria bacterium RIFCSPHIGHO2_12_FULL_48_11]|uniref:DUF456 domain-containing protein n=1 Tax=Candidatus Doudnabacteria bacterium RIFCSPHIGHO2_01_FULL_46_24 TaxID=1817825 RepID=A0A1F5NUI0_9BACT|nr:MAG: hypothetical protein A2720_03775 [Candidatus Doudnabacteria bacterium RIFCSPHIGHO2_01_FULL_46_24]OGE95867.1 MAG: hypothetical protein A3E98_03785 [Candidatus Doudnabacteria bacterium RIFCSPHIGHO2_12_FULL_48_11]
MWAIISGILILIGLAGTILPFLPGPPVALAGLIILGIATHFEKVGAVAISVFSALTLLTILFDIFGPALAAKGYKSTGYGVMGALLGAIFGVILLGPLGAFLGPFLGAFLGEILAPKAELHTALRTAWAAFVGIIIGTLFKLAVTLSMAAYFVISLFK